ncbi:MAG: ABC transporter permease [Bryobacteraceae bacterium]|jgi:ribose transport system permease protein
MRREFGIFIALVILAGVLAVSNADFYSAVNLLNLTRQIAMLGIFAIGTGFVIIGGGIDLSVGSVIGITGVIIAALSAPSGAGLGQPLWVSIPIALGVAVLVGLIQGFLIAGLGIQPFITTLGGMLVLRGISQTICQGGTISFGASSFRDLSDHGLFRIGNSCLLPYPMLIFLLVAGLAVYFLHFSVFGRQVYAIGGNRQAAAYSGINVRRVEILTYVVSSGLAGLAGVIYAAYIGQMSHTVGSSYELIAIAAAVLGGCSLSGGEGTIPGIVTGSAVMKVIENGINLFKLTLPGGKEWRLNTNWQYTIVGVVILSAVILDRAVHWMRNRRERSGAG